MKTVCVLGTGIMGAGVVRRLQDCGFSIQIYNRTLENAQALVGKKTRVCATPAAAAAGCSLIVSFLSDDDAARNVWFGPDGVTSAALVSNAVCLESSTLSAAFIDQWGRAIEAVGARPIDCPVTGSKGGARNGTLTLFVGAERDSCGQFNDYVTAISSQQFWFGNFGDGMKFKLLYNALGGTILVALAEAIRCGLSAGIQKDTLLEALGTNVNGWSTAVARSKGSAMISGDHNTVDCKLSTLSKDLSYALQLSGTLHLEAPLTLAAAYIFANAALHSADLDMSAVINVAPE